MIDGWQQRYTDQRIIMAAYCAIPVYQVNCKKPPRLEDLVPEAKKNNNDFANMTIEQLRAFASDDELWTEE